jgi:hypothetical protein
MKSKQLLNVTIAALALSPLAAFAGGGDEQAKQWLDSLVNTSTTQEVRIGRQPAVELSDQHPIEVAAPARSTASRGDVKAELARYGQPVVGA